MHLSIEVEVPLTFKLRMAKTSFSGLPSHPSSHPRLNSFHQSPWHLSLAFLESVDSTVSFLALPIPKQLSRTSKIQKSVSQHGLGHCQQHLFCITWAPSSWTGYINSARCSLTYMLVLNSTHTNRFKSLIRSIFCQQQTPRPADFITLTNILW